MVEQEQEQVTMDNIAVLEPAVGMAHAGPSAELPPNEETIHIEPLDLSENPNLRTRLRVYLILASLYVKLPGLSERHFIWLMIPPPARPLRSSPRSNRHRDNHTHNLRRSPLCYRLRLDRRRLLASQRRGGSNLGQMQ